MNTEPATVSDMKRFRNLGVSSREAGGSADLLVVDVVTLVTVVAELDIEDWAEEFIDDAGIFENTSKHLLCTDDTGSEVTNCWSQWQKYEQVRYRDTTLISRLDSQPWWWCT